MKDFTQEHFEKAKREERNGEMYIECPSCDGTGFVHSHNPHCWDCRGGYLPVSKYLIKLQELIERKRKDSIMASIHDHLTKLNSTQLDQLHTKLNKSNELSEIYIIKGTCDCDHYWIVKGFYSLKKAESKLQELIQWLKDNNCHMTLSEDGTINRLDNSNPPKVCPLDHKYEYGKSGTDYWITPIEFE